MASYHNAGNKHTHLRKSLLAFIGVHLRQKIRGLFFSLPSEALFPVAHRATVFHLPVKCSIVDEPVRELPLSTIIIALAMLVFSVLIVSKVGGRIPLSRRANTVLFFLGVAALLTGLYLHLNQTPAARPLAAGTNRQEKHTSESFIFTFSPARARWGEQVEIQVPFSAESVTVYLNGMPLPKRLNEGGRTIRITIPSGAKTGYLELERNGARTHASEPISINP